MQLCLDHCNSRLSSSARCCAISIQASRMSLAPSIGAPAWYTPSSFLSLFLFFSVVVVVGSNTIVKCEVDS